MYIISSFYERGKKALGRLSNLHASRRVREWHIQNSTAWPSCLMPLVHPPWTVPEAPSCSNHLFFLKHLYHLGPDRGTTHCTNPRNHCSPCSAGISDAGPSLRQPHTQSRECWPCARPNDVLNCSWNRELSTFSQRPWSVQ